MRFHDAPAGVAMRAGGALAVAVCALTVVACGSQGPPSSAVGGSPAITGNSQTTTGKTEGVATACATSQLKITLTHTGAPEPGIIPTIHPARKRGAVVEWPPRAWPP